MTTKCCVQVTGNTRMGSVRHRCAEIVATSGGAMPGRLDIGQTPGLRAREVRRPVPWIIAARWAPRATLFHANRERASIGAGYFVPRWHGFQ